MSDPLFNPLLALSPIDGRYANKVGALRDHLSEYALIRTRVWVEIQWLVALSQEKNIPEVPAFSEEAQDFLIRLAEQFSLEDATCIKNIEKVTNHDVKAVEYFIKQQMTDHTALATYQEFVHFACTSEDINNLSYALMLKNATTHVLVPQLNQLLSFITHFSHQYADQPMLSRTHGQAATPTTLGKEFANVAARLKRGIDKLSTLPYLGKINGAVGNFNAHMVAYPNVDWLQVSKQFVEQLGLDWNAYTTQIEPHDYIAELSQALMQIHVVLIDFCRDIWGYVSQDYFKQKLKAGEVGSSTMPHKVNPIDFENSEGNLGLANALLGHFAEKLPISRWQRDLSDSTVLRALGSGFGHAMIAYHALNTGLNKLEVNAQALEDDLQKHPEVLAEAIQTVMRRYGMHEPYEQLKNFSRGKKLTQQDLQQFVATLSLPPEVQQHLAEMQPRDYIGLAEILAKKI